MAAPQAHFTRIFSSATSVIAPHPGQMASPGGALKEFPQAQETRAMAGVYHGKF